MPARYQLWVLTAPRSDHNWHLASRTVPQRTKRDYDGRVEFVTITELHNRTADVLGRVRNGSEIMITEDDMVIATMIAVNPAKKAFLTKAELIALLQQNAADPSLKTDLARLAGDTTDDLGTLR
jgi:antitoxin (DNA-binding transcriptional repressor) of toxin-antitoxin stability system